MNNELEEFLALCERIHKRMEHEGSWPWGDQKQDEPDSTLGENLVDSEH